MKALLDFFSKRRNMELVLLLFVVLFSSFFLVKFAGQVKHKLAEIHSKYALEQELLYTEFAEGEVPLSGLKIDSQLLKNQVLEAWLKEQDDGSIQLFWIYSDKLLKIDKYAIIVNQKEIAITDKKFFLLDALDLNSEHEIFVVALNARGEIIGVSNPILHQ